MRLIFLVNSMRSMLKPKTVVVELMGGLGNQLFQFAAGLFACRELGYRLELNTQFFANHPAHDGFCLDKVMDLSGIQLVGGRCLFQRKIRESGTHFQLQQVIAEEKTVSSVRGLVLRGYWQTAYTVAEVRSELLNRLIKGPDWDTSVQPGECFIHVRRGDYFTPVNQKIYDVIPENYYRDAVMLVLNRNPDTVFRVFSDDYEYVRHFIQSLPTATYAIEKGGSTFQDFHQMLRCTGGICANSSFSWWASFLVESKSIVVIPKIWDNLSPDTAHHRWPINGKEMSSGMVAFWEGD